MSLGNAISIDLFAATSNCWTRTDRAAMSSLLSCLSSSRLHLCQRRRAVVYDEEEVRYHPLALALGGALTYCGHVGSPEDVRIHIKGFEDSGVSCIPKKIEAVVFDGIMPSSTMSAPHANCIEDVVSILVDPESVPGDPGTDERCTDIGLRCPSSLFIISAKASLQR